MHSLPADELWISIIEEKVLIKKDHLKVQFDDNCLEYGLEVFSTGVSICYEGGNLIPVVTTGPTILIYFRRYYSNDLVLLDENIKKNIKRTKCITWFNATF